MTEPAEQPLNAGDLPQAIVEPPRRRVAFVWIVPLLAAAVAIGIAVQRVLTEGPTITILFHAAGGLAAGKTVLKYKDVDIGQVTEVRLAQEFSKVAVTVKVDRSARGLMVEDARFWIVAPRVSLSGVSGLGTLLSGNYIGMQVGRSTREQHQFVGLETPPAITDQPGRRFLLKAHDLGSLGIGAPIYYRRLTVGEIAAYALAPDGDGIDVTVFINAAYERYVTTETRFWDASGIDLTLNAEGLELRTQSLVSILAGGLAFDAPAFATGGEPASENAVFTLYGSRAAAMRQPDPVARRYLLYPESAAGLRVGAPVKLLGLSAGEVSEIGVALDPKTRKFRPRVLITFFPERLLARLAGAQAGAGRAFMDAGPAARLELIRHQVDDLGLRAQVQSGNLLTGERFVSLDYHPEAPREKLDWDQDPLVIPVLAGGFDAIEAQVQGVLAQVDKILVKVDKMPLDGIADELNKTIKTLDAVLKAADTKTLPEVSQTLAGLDRTLATAQRVLKDTNATLLSPDAPGQQELRDALQEVARTARSLRVLTDYLERHPEALIRGKGQENQ
ncbi:MlaD family protein [uncultured Thiodictyon sp.]|uniref:PqiB family protein n=2 Tax=uncultured Thiodictyon sp. TaxID=1846217 RepID=UPI0025EA1945|nr:MlaD family protein [uncultured Thiodictyon sp.]